MTDRVLIKDLIPIPEQVHSGDFVLTLSAGIGHADATVKQYVVTPQLQKCFDDALGFIKGAVETRTSKACYLHGSFGSGKSHFMAVLNLLLAGNVQARSIPELAGVVSKHTEWSQGRKFLMVPYHMVGQDSLDSAIMGQYADHVRRLHPEAPLPGFYVSEKLFEDARGLRATMGDDAFFGKLGGGSGGGGGGGWGLLDDTGTAWTAESFEAAMAQDAKGAERQRLISDLVKTYFQAYAGMSAFVSLDDGLAIMSQHAKSLGYDGVILFLDELILWLATRAADSQFVATEGAKLSKLVEATNADRPVPLISFVARQRDLRELVGDAMAGSLQLQFTDVLKYWEARFHKITLEDRNLPVIARKRILRPVDDTAAQTLDAACRKVLDGKAEVVDTLLTAEGERDMFRQVYPFSPALVQTLVAVSSALQRERTALKLMLQLLVERREDLELGQLIPVGDLFDAIAEGDEPFSEGMRLLFENAKKLYRQKMVPLLERQHDVTARDIADGTADAVKARNFENDARLLKTLLLAALVPEEKSLRGMTPGRLAALNHGTVRSPIPGREGHTVLTKVKGWAAEIGEIKVTEDTNPLISIQITGVDTDPILQNAKHFDNLGNRRRKIRELLFSVLGIQEKADLLAQNLHPFVFDWRGTRREVSVSYENVREMSDDRLSGQEGKWTVIFDFPFDDDGHSPNDDMARLHDFRARGHDVPVLAWLPAFLSRRALSDLGTLVILDELFKGDRFAEYARHLSPTDREQARSLLANQQSQLQKRIMQCLEVAYGITEEPRDAISAEVDATEHLQSLDSLFQPQMPVGNNLKLALEALLDRVLAYQYPGHPRFEADIKPALVKRAWAELDKGLKTPDGRCHVADRRLRDEVRVVLEPLKLAQVGSTHLVPLDVWRTHFSQQHARDGGGRITVRTLRDWIDRPNRMGLPTILENLIILAYAQQTNRIFLRAGVPVDVTLDALPDDAELREQALPPEAEWQTATARAKPLFGLVIGSLRNATNVASLARSVREAAAARRAPVIELRDRLETALRSLGLDPDEADRVKTVRACADLLAALDTDDDEALVLALARARVATSEPAMAHTMTQAAQAAPLLTGNAWSVIEALRDLSDHRKDRAQAVLEEVRGLLVADEHALGLAKGLVAQQAAATTTLATPAPAPTPTPTPTPGEYKDPPPTTVAPGARDDGRGLPLDPRGRPTAATPRERDPAVQAEVVSTAQHDGLTAAEAREAIRDLEAVLRDHPDARVSLAWRVMADDKVTT